jgi:hypothetical protein
MLFGPKGTAAMLRRLTDEDVHGDIVDGLRRRQPALDRIRGQDVGLGHLGLETWTNCKGGGAALSSDIARYGESTMNVVLRL